MLLRSCGGEKANDESKSGLPGRDGGDRVKNSGRREIRRPTAEDTQPCNLMLGTAQLETAQARKMTVRVSAVRRPPPLAGVRSFYMYVATTYVGLASRATCTVEFCVRTTSTYYM